MIMDGIWESVGSMGDNSVSSLLQLIMFNSCSHHRHNICTQQHEQQPQPKEETWEIKHAFKICPHSPSIALSKATPFQLHQNGTKATAIYGNTAANLDADSRWIMGGLDGLHSAINKDWIITCPWHIPSRGERGVSSHNATAQDHHLAV